MRDLFNMDKRDYNPDGKVFRRPSARAIIAQSGKVLLVYSPQYDYYKFPGGGIEAGEDHKMALIREVAEETGYQVLPNTIEAYGRVLRRQMDSRDSEAIFEQENFYYFCDVTDRVFEKKLDAYEAEEGFVAVWEDPFKASHVNRYSAGRNEDPEMVIRESRVLDLVDKELRKRARIAHEAQTLEGLGHPEYREMLSFVEAQLSAGSESTGSGKLEINYSRFQHVKRVLGWVLRLYNHMEDKTGICLDDLCIATIFHDVGRSALADKTLSHAHAGVPITRQYLLEHGYDSKRTEYICSLVAAHSDKECMTQEGLDINLLLLMEADLMDEMGALGIVMDCMITEKRNGDAIFEDCYDHICRFTHRQQQNNPMVTPAGRAAWAEKTDLVNSFTELLGQDLIL